MMMVEMELVEIQMATEGGTQIIILQEKEGTRSFPIFIGNYEIAVLDQSVRGMETARPLTHDLVLNAINELGATLTGVMVDELRSDTFIGKLMVRAADGEMVHVDSRPSDAIILAVKCSVPIFVAEEVLAATNLANNDSDDE